MIPRCKLISAVAPKRAIDSLHCGVCLRREVTEGVVDQMVDHGRRVRLRIVPGNIPHGVQVVRQGPLNRLVTTVVNIFPGQDCAYRTGPACLADWSD